MHVMPNGQVTVPEDVREEFGLRPDGEVDFELADRATHVTRTSRPTGETRGERLVRKLRGSAPPGGLTTDEIMAITRGED